MLVELSPEAVEATAPAEEAYICTFECKGRSRFFVDLFSQAAEATAPAEAEKADTSPRICTVGCD